MTHFWLLTVQPQTWLGEPWKLEGGSSLTDACLDFMAVCWLHFLAPWFCDFTMNQNNQLVRKGQVCVPGLPPRSSDCGVWVGSRGFAFPWINIHEDFRLVENLEALFSETLTVAAAQLALRVGSSPDLRTPLPLVPGLTQAQEATGTSRPWPKLLHQRMAARCS